MFVLGPSRPSEREVDALSCNQRLYKYENLLIFGGRSCSRSAGCYLRWAPSGGNNSQTGSSYGRLRQMSNLNGGGECKSFMATKAPSRSTGSRQNNPRGDTCWEDQHLRMD